MNQISEYLSRIEQNDPCFTTLDTRNIKSISVAELCGLLKVSHNTTLTTLIYLARCLSLEDAPGSSNGPDAPGSTSGS